MCSLDTSPLRQLGPCVLPPLADSDRRSSPGLAGTLFSVALDGLHLQRCQKQIKNAGKISAVTFCFSRGYLADCQFSLHSDLLAPFILLCCILSAERCVKVIDMKSSHFAVK